VILRTVKYYLYKRWTGRPSWRASYLFDRACTKLREGDLVLDAGANVGDVTAKFADRGATVHAFEPDPYAFAKLSERFAGLANVTLHNAAIGDAPGVVKLYRAPSFETDPTLLSQSSSLFADKVNVATEDAISVAQIDIVDFIRALDAPVRIMKIDIEGAEVPVLEALIASGLMDRIERIFAETHESKIPQLRERTNKLRAMAQAKWPKKVNLDWH
jgi:FkbM family methyltransferase